MEKRLLKKCILLFAVCAISFIAFARQEKVIKVISNGNVIKEYKSSEIDYIQVDDFVDVPSDVSASSTNNSITITWSAVSGATYNVYRSSNNVNFTLLAGNIKTTRYTDNSPLRGANYYRVKAIVEGVESDFTSSVAAALTDNGMESGIYLGVYGFNQALYKYPVTHLDESTLGGFNGFIDGLTMKNGTLLYYSVEEALNSMQSTQFPTDLSSVALVTFTDGLDQGSMMKNDSYENDLDYLDALNKKIKTQTVAGKKIAAYSVGVRGSDVSDINKFRENLKKLASATDNAYEVTSMSEVNAKFQEIAQQLSKSNYIQTINLKMPGVANGTLVRFTFDNAKFATSSKIYIEGRFNLKNKSLEDIKYVGLTSTSGTTVSGTVEDIFVSFTFEGVQNENNYLVKSEFTDEWTYVPSNSTWQINSEFDKSENSEIHTERNSAAIMLVLDCSSSLGSQFKTAQTNAKDFIKTLYEASSDTGGQVTPKEPDWLFVDPTKVTSNDGEPSDGSIAGLFDDDYNTYYQTAWRMVPDRSEPYGSYLDIEFENNINKLNFEMIIRNANLHCYPRDIDLYWSNNKTNWSKFAEIRNLPINKGSGESIFANNPDSGDGLYAAPQSFKYLRFCVITNSFGESLFESDKDIYWHLAELRFYDKQTEKSGNGTTPPTPAKQIFTVNGVSFNMVHIEGGQYRMGSNDGSNDEKPIHFEQVESFSLGETEVTQELWTAVMGDNPSRFKGANLPVEMMSHSECLTFISKLNKLTGQSFRLPTESEWEYAARGGNYSHGYNYSGSNNVDDVAWHSGNSGYTTHPVASKKPNELGLYDMSGNVWEWCSDNYCDDYSSTRSSDDIVHRGGSYGMTSYSCRVACRASCNSSSYYSSLGLRLAL